MCDHCRSTTAPGANRRSMRAPIQEKALVFATSLSKKDSLSGASCGQWRKNCCGGGCCGSAMSNEPCCGKDQDYRRQAAGIPRQFQQTPMSRTLYSPENRDNSSGYVPHQQTSCDSGYYYYGNEMTSSCGTGAPATGIGVCPAMMRNLPCTPLNEPKCFGGDCRDEDTESEHSREI